MVTKRVTKQDGSTVCERCVVADSIVARMKGLLGRRSLEAGEGILLRPAPSIHTFFMHFAIDVVFCDDRLEVLAVRPELKAWRVAGQRGAKAALELGAGEADRVGLAVGDRLRLET